MFSLPVWVQKHNFLIENKKERDSYLSDLFDFWASFANQWATLAPWENQAECHRWLACHVAVCHCRANILRENSKICFSTLTVKTSALFDKSIYLFIYLTGLRKRCVQVLQTWDKFYKKSFIHSGVKQNAFWYSLLHICSVVPPQTSVRSWRKLWRCPPWVLWW